MSCNNATKQTAFRRNAMSNYNENLINIILIKEI